MSWWCAQRTLVSLLELVQRFPVADYYMLLHSDTVVFRGNLEILLRVLDREVLRDAEDLFMGHGRLLSKELGPFIMAGGGVLLRGLTLRRLVADGLLSQCAERQLQGDWCWH